MNINSANAICLQQLLNQLGYVPFRTRKNSIQYFSPLREERTPSFYVNPAKNLWYDFGSQQGGKTIQFALSWLNSQGKSAGISDTLRWLENVSWTAPSIPVQHHEPQLSDGPTLVIRAKGKIQHPTLIKYLKERGIDQKVASQYLQQLRLFNHNTQKNFFALGLHNEDGGYELRNPYFKGCVSPKTVTFIRGKIPKPDHIHIFEGLMDFLSVMTQRGGEPLDDDAIILNSVSQIKDGAAYIRHYGYKILYSWMDNDDAGNSAAEELDRFCSNEPGLQHQRMNDKYKEFKDVNEWHKHRLGL
ncbi:MAG: toprim domain-containing protein [Bacteroidota bacterium]